MTPHALHAAIADAILTGCDIEADETRADLRRFAGLTGNEALADLLDGVAREIEQRDLDKWMAA